MLLASLATEKGGGFTYFFDPQNPESQKLPKAAEGSGNTVFCTALSLS